MNTEFINDLTLNIMNMNNINFDTFVEAFKILDNKMCEGCSGIYLDDDKRRRNCYIYILCDDLGDAYNNNCNNVDLFTMLLKTFYSGKGQSDRYLKHFENAKGNGIFSAKYFNMDKIKVIQTKWENGGKIHVIRGFDCATAAEAHNREASLIDMMGLDNLTNKIRGTYYGDIINWSMELKHNYGFFIAFQLHKKYCIEGTKSLSRKNVKKIFKKYRK